MAGFIVAIISGALMSLQGVLNTNVTKSEQYMGGSRLRAVYSTCNLHYNVVV